jgi:hypothetical protein
MVNDQAAAAEHGRVLSPYVLFDILLRLPAKYICRYWLSLTSDPLFVEAHAARHRAPLIAASFRGDGDHVHLMDLSGRVVKRLPCSTEGLRCVRSSRLHLVCVADSDGRCSVIDPATGAVSDLPETPPEEEWWGDVQVTKDHDVFNVFQIGRVSSTGECKVLRLSRVEWQETYVSHDLQCSCPRRRRRRRATAVAANREP